MVTPPGLSAFWPVRTRGSARWRSERALVDQPASQTWCVRAPHCELTRAVHASSPETGGCSGQAVLILRKKRYASRASKASPPRFHLTRYAGVLAPNAKLRSEVVPGRARDEAEAEGDACVDAKQGELFGGEAAANDEEKDRDTRSSRHPWAWLLKRVFAVEVLVCVQCAGKLRIVEIATEPEATRRIARDERRRRGGPVGHASTLEARGPPRGPPGQLAFTFRRACVGAGVTTSDCGTLRERGGRRCGPVRAEHGARPVGAANRRPRSATRRGGGCVDGATGIVPSACEVRPSRCACGIRGLDVLCAALGLCLTYLRCMFTV